MEFMNKQPNITVIEQPMNWDPAQGFDVAQSLLAAHPDLKAIHCVSDAVTLSVLEAVKLAGREDEIVITSYDGNPDANAAVERGDFLMTLLTGSYKTGYWNVHVGVQLVRGISPGPEHILNMPTHFVMNPDTAARFRDLGLFAGEGILTPAEADIMHGMYRDDVFDPSLAP
jgi:ABC-type sugar transport system substrate-binding protein